jgi:signal transduction histidine kinase
VDPEVPSPSSRQRWFPLLYGLSWTLVGLAFAGQHYLKAATFGEGVSWSVAIQGALADWYVFALLAIPAFKLGRRFNLGGDHWRMRLALHGVGGAVFSLVWILVRAGVGEWLFPEHRSEKPLHDLIRYVLVATFFFNMLVYWVVVTVAHVVAYSESLRDRERRVMDLEGRLNSARLMALQMQLNPHFLFNALNGIGTLMFRDVDAADAMLVSLAELLRHALDRSGRQLVTLGEELAFLDRYLTLEQMRFGDRLSVLREISPEVQEAQVPNLILQPLVENAIKHGVEPLLVPGRIIIRASESVPGRLRLEVQDNGKGLPADREPALGVGTSNTLARLNQLYGPQAGFRLETSPGGGVLAVVELPLSR